MPETNPEGAPGGVAVVIPAYRTPGIGSAYFLRGFNVVSVFLTAGVPLALFGTAWSQFHWYRSQVSGVVATTGTVMIGTLAIILGFHLLLQAIVLDVQNEPGRLQR